MRSWRALLIMAALRIARTEDGAALPLEIYKCCGPFEMLSGDGSACVNASWPRNHTLKERPQSDLFDLPQVLVQPGDAPWVARWLPPGVPPQRVGEVHVGFLYPFKRKYRQRQMWTVETSAEWDERQVEAAGSAYFSRRVVFIKAEYGSVMGPEPRPFFGSVMLGLGGYRPLGTYCVDAAQAPLAPFVLMAQPVCELEVCVRKCCPAREVVQVKDGGGWGCRMDRERAAGWPRRSSFAALLPFQNAAEYYDRLSSCIERQLTDSVTTIALHLSPEDELAAHLLQRRYHNYMWSTWDTCVDFEVLQNGTMRDTIFYCPESRITRGVIWLLRHLCFVSVLLLVVALASVACNSGMRLKAHGWCLACHISCLLGFNLGQVSYNMSIGNQVDAFGFVPPHLRNMCRTFAFPMYFLLMAANCWLTALCFNLAWGFRKLQIVRPGGGKDWMRLLALSAFAWGLPALMTGLCAYAYDNKRRWFSPSLTETRTCFHEVAHELGPHANLVVLASYVAGTALFYYGPVLTLIVANAICVARTLSRVQFLRRGNSVLHREENKAAQTPRKTGGGDERGGAVRTKIAARSAAADAKTMRLYVKMLLMTGVVDFGAEIIGWATVPSRGRSTLYLFRMEDDLFFRDHVLAYRATGYAIDCFRAACVVWLAAPDGGYWRALRGRLRGGKRKSYVDRLAVREGGYFDSLHGWFRGFERGRRRR